MGRDDWFRRTSWSPKDEAAFRARLGRSRSEGQKAQYVRIQALTLYETGTPRLVAAALGLCEECLCDYPESIDRAATLELAGHCSWLRGAIDDAVRYFRAALEREAEMPSYVTTARFDLGRLVAEESLSDEYDLVLEALDAFGDGAFPWHTYMGDGTRAIVAADRGESEAARRLAASALAAARVKDSGLGRGRQRVGLVVDVKTPFHRRLKKLARA